MRAKKSIFARFQLDFFNRSEPEQKSTAGCQVIGTVSGQEYLFESIRVLTGKDITIKLTHNRTRLVSFKKNDDGIALRVDEAFVDAPKIVITDLANWIKSPRSGCPASVRQFANSICKPATPITPRKVALRQIGKVHNLLDLYNKVNREFFDGKIAAEISYGKSAYTKKVGTRRLGSYSRKQRLITIHPILDSPAVPEKVIAFTIFHEMLHALQPDNHPRPHDRSFRTAEKKHPDFDVVMLWRKKHDRLLRGGR